MLIASFDPGSTKTGFALVRATDLQRFSVTYITAGQIVSDEVSFNHLLLELADSQGEQIQIIAVERPAGFVHDKFRGPHVITTATVAGGIAWVARTKGYKVYEIPAATVRTALFGKPRLAFKQKKGDVDRAIKSTLPTFVWGFPAKSNVHTRDALALAVAANWLRLSLQRKSA